MLYALCSMLLSKLTPGPSLWNDFVYALDVSGKRGV
jgi:hypothetical protein